MLFNSKKTLKFLKKLPKLLKKNYNKYTKKFDKSSIWLKLFLWGFITFIHKKI